MQNADVENSTKPGEKASEECCSGYGQRSLPISWQESALPSPSPLSPCPSSTIRGRRKVSSALQRLEKPTLSQDRRNLWAIFLSSVLDS